MDNWRLRKFQRAAGPRDGNGLLTRLRGDVRGNALAITAAALIPLAGLVGSAVDTARLYYVKVRLQQACDAGALAGRKFMVNDTFDATTQLRANTFFDNNFKDGVFGTTGRTRTYSKTSNNQVRGVASVTVPMTLMRIFGSSEVALEATCEAKLEVPNLDVMFVLDTTGSMGETNPDDTVSRITALRASVLNFYDSLERAKVGTSQIRYGFVPYSNTVNVGLLLNKDWVVDRWTYQSRERADITQKVTTSTQGAWITSTSAWTFISGTNGKYVTYGDPEDCTAPSNTQTSTTTNPAWTTNSDGSQTRTVVETTNGSSFSASLSSGVCTITETRYNNYKKQRVETRTPNPNAGQTTTTTSDVYWWNYKPVEFDLTKLKGATMMAGGTITPELSGGNTATWSNRNVTWNATSACIEERDTVRTSDYSTIPATAYDLNVDMVPTAGTPATQWRPYIPAMVYARSYTGYTNPTTVTTSWPTNTTAPVRSTSNFINLSSYPNDYAACPTASRKLATITRAALNTYLNSLKVAGRTYHDIGFIWGLRLLSAQGLFSTENSTAPNGSAIARHIIFMTDGQTDTSFADYDAYGLSAIDRRRTPANRLPGNDEQNTIVENRLAALCQVAKRKNMTVWVIAFGTTLSSLLDDCATPGGHSFQANNAAELNDAFTDIASNIAKLRLSR